MTKTSDSIVETVHTPPRRALLGSRPAKMLLIGLAKRYVTDPFEIRDEHNDAVFTSGTGPCPTLTILDKRAWSMVLTGGSAGLGEAYIRNWWTTNDLTGVLRALLRALARTEAQRTGVHRFFAPLTERVRKLRSADKARDRRNIIAHYDIGNEFFKLLLDPTLMYSSGYFSTPDVSMEEASNAKNDRLCRSLGLRAGHRLMEIGTGWGGFAMHAASKFGVHVTTTTISNEQFDYATERVNRAGLSEQITVLNEDYRDLSGTFDRLVSIEMIEAVDWREHETYFAKCETLLKPDGVMGLQAITINDDRYERAKATNDFIKSFIFPGGCLPSYESIVRSTSAATSLKVQSADRFGSSYVTTLQRWRDSMNRNTSAITALGLDDSFIRLWDFYLSYCETGFAEKSIDVQQILLARTGYVHS
ncbi:MAG: cyclopropane-fatty-acyl-phospholipid synthase family protein [Acidimicrobiales bacterium]